MSILVFLSTFLIVDFHSPKGVQTFTSSATSEKAVDRQVRSVNQWGVRVKPLLLTTHVVAEDRNPETHKLHLNYSNPWSLFATSTTTELDGHSPFQRRTDTEDEGPLCRHPQGVCLFQKRENT